jgi:major intracellular serine protease
MKVLVIFLLLIPKVYAKEIKILEIDTGVDLSHEEIRSHVNMGSWENNPNYQDFHGHGTHIAGLILKDTCKEVELISCKYFDLSYTNKQDMENSINCFKLAIKTHFDIINYSSGGIEFNQLEYDIIKSIKNTIIVVAAGNNGHDISLYNYFPATYNIPNIIVVGNLNGFFRNSSSNYGFEGMVYEQGTRILSTFPGGRFGVMTGTSQATAIHTNRLIRSMCEKK